MQNATEDVVRVGERSGLSPAEVYVPTGRLPATESAEADTDRQLALLLLAGAGTVTAAWTAFLAWAAVRAALWVWG